MAGSSLTAGSNAAAALYEQAGAYKPLFLEAHISRSLFKKHRMEERWTSYCVGFS